MIKIIDLRDGRDSGIFEKLASRSQIEYGDVLRRVEDIVGNVKKEGNSAVIKYTEMFDKVSLKEEELKVTPEEIEEAYGKVDRNLLEAIRKARENIEKFHEKQKEKSWFSTEDDGVILGQLVRPIEVMGIYVPGGTAAYPSSVLMCAMPAKVAGVGKIIMATPPGEGGKVNPVILVTACEAGVEEIYKVGGAQGVAAMAFGTETIPKVDKIVGPGNIYVATAKRIVYGYCDIDMIAGPSEIMVVADDTTEPAFVAADLLSQAEHDELASSVLVTTSEDIAKSVKGEIEKQAERQPRKEMILKSLENYGAIIIVDNLDSAAEVVNRIAPEHLELCIEDPFSFLGSVKNAGAIFLGNYSTESLGDYIAGPNHVLPTSGTARFFSPLNVSDFIKKSSIISYTRKALEKVKDDVILFAESEGLKAHADAVRVRFEE
ncbi:MAG TPA: histidinol dehydrogenase [Ruminiclostridium sp.]|uniref:histidinol dehydrogenase n=1 Tax=Acetivibrio saccincola TaxID=1677857 RepID=UPI000AEE3953|nr:histidinol dehydrogenase [Acetivibrio saccincola]NLW26931.1 histidinol dehydrogenase [Acetivibrio saccincola]HAA43879.1 histidinol dehydrogenase [Ruminiclostridium sp.]